MITEQNVIDLLLKYEQERPHDVNPTRLSAVVSSCVYTDPTNPERHCIAGQLMVDLDMEAPDSFEMTHVAILMDGLVDKPGVVLMRRAQIIADGFTVSDLPDTEGTPLMMSQGEVGPRPWGQVVAQLREKGWL